MQETRQGQRAPMNEFGVEVSMFCVLHGLTKKGLAEEAGVKYDTLMKTMRGKRAGHTARAAIQEVMERYGAAAGKAKRKGRGA